MRIIILGAGAIGSVYGAKLSKFNDVTLVARKNHADIINRKGLKIIGVESKTYRLKTTTRIKKIENDALIILTTKVYDSEKAIRPIKKLLKKNNIILCLQNGYSPEEIVKKIVERKCLVIRGITAVGVSFLKPGIVRRNNIGFASIEKSGKSKKIAENFSKCGLECYVSKNIEEDIWNKLILNCMLNPISAILRIKNKGLLKYSNLLQMVFREVILVARKEGLKLNEKETYDWVIKVIKSSRDNYSSMYQDILKGKKTEIGFLNGKVVELAHKHGIEVPVNQVLVHIIKEIEKISI